MRIQKRKKKKKKKKEEEKKRKKEDIVRRVRVTMVSIKLSQVKLK